MLSEALGHHSLKTHLLLLVFEGFCADGMVKEQGTWLASLVTGEITSIAPCTEESGRTDVVYKCMLLSTARSIFLLQCLLTYAGKARIAYYVLPSCQQLHACLLHTFFHHKLFVHLLIQSNKAVDICGGSVCIPKGLRKVVLPSS